MTVYSVLKSIVISTYFLGSCPSQYLWLWYFLGCHLKKYWWLCWNGLCSCVGTGLCLLFWAVFSHSCLYNPLFWPILWASHAQWDPLANQNIPLFCVIYFWDAVLKNRQGGTRGNLEWPPNSKKYIIIRIKSFNLYNIIQLMKRESISNLKPTLFGCLTSEDLHWSNQFEPSEGWHHYLACKEFLQSETQLRTDPQDRTIGQKPCLKIFY